MMQSTGLCHKISIKGINRLRILLATVLVLPALMLPASANSPGPANSFTVHVETQFLPEGAHYVDLLIPMDANDSRYVSLNENITKTTGLSADCELVTYDTDGYISFSAHYRDAVSDIQLKKPTYINDDGYLYADFCMGSELESATTQFEDITTHYSTIHLVFLDENGRILKVSEPFDVSQPERGYLTGNIHYDGQANTASMGKYDTTSVEWVFTGLATCFGILFSVVIETAVAYAMTFRSKALWRIAVVNVISQTIMRIFFVFSPFSYWNTVLVAEVAVYALEFAVFCRMFPDRKKGRLFEFTILANSASLLIGLAARSLWNGF